MSSEPTREPLPATLRDTPADPGEDAVALTSRARRGSSGSVCRPRARQANGHAQHDVRRLRPVRALPDDADGGSARIRARVRHVAH